MKKIFLCPKCQSELNPGEKIILKVHRGPFKGLFLLSPQLGDYSLIHPSDFPVSQGEEFDFCCPVCNFDLTSRASEQFAELAFRQGSVSGRVMFSKIRGEHATFLLLGQGEVETFGEHAPGYSTLNFFGEGAKE